MSYFIPGWHNTAFLNEIALGIKPFSGVNFVAIAFFRTLSFLWIEVTDVIKLYKKQFLGITNIEDG